MSAEGRIFFASSPPCADRERGCFKEAEVENGRYIPGQWWRARVAKHSYRALNDVRHHKTTADDQKNDQCGQLKREAKDG